MKKKSLILMLVSIIVFVSMVAIAAYAYFAASVDANAEAIINATLPNGSFTFYVVTDGNIEYTFNSNKMLASGSSTSSIASDDANLNVVLRSPDATSLTTCSYDLVWEWTSTVQYTESDVTLPYTGGYNYEMSVKGTSTTTGNPSSNPSTNANLDEKDLSKFTWSGTKGQAGYKTTLVSGATISSQSAETDTVTSWNILSQMYNIPVAQPNLQGKEFKAKVYVDNVDCNITNVLESEEDSGNEVGGNSTKPTVVNGTIDTIGSEVAIGDEHFYIINSTDTTVTMLAKYNLLVGNNFYINEAECSEAGYNWESDDEECSAFDTISNTTIGYNLQSSSALGEYRSEYVINDNDDNILAIYSNANKTDTFDHLTSDQIANVEYYAGYTANTVASSSATVDFAKTVYPSYWIDGYRRLISTYGSDYPAWVYNDNATIKTYVDNYEEKLEDMYNITISCSRLIKYEELISLGCIYTSSKFGCLTPEVITTHRTWIFDTTYWSGTADNMYDVFYVHSNGWFSGISGSNANDYGDHNIGIRPVIEISKDQFN